MWFGRTEEWAWSQKNFSPRMSSYLLASNRHHAKALSHLVQRTAPVPEMLSS